MTRNGPKTRASNSPGGPGSRFSISSRGSRLFRSLASRTQTPRPSGFGCRSSVLQREHRVGARDDDVAGTSGCAPRRRGRAARSRTARRRAGSSRAEERLRLRARGLRACSAPTRRAAACGASAQPTSSDHERGGQRRREQRAADASTRSIPAPTRIAKNGRTKIRWRDSGDVEPPRRAARNAATGTPITQSGERAAPRRARHEPDQREHEHDDEHGPAAGAEVAGRLPQVA